MSKRKLIFFLAFFATLLNSHAQRGSILFEPGIFVLPQKTWFFGSGIPETFNYAGGISLGLRFGDVHGLQVAPMLSIQQSVRVVQPCEGNIPPCPPLIKSIYYFKLPLLYRATLFMNEAVLIKALAGPQFSFPLYPSDYRKYYNAVVVEGAAGFEICHYITGNLYINYGLRADMSLTKPVKPDVLTPFNQPILSDGAKNGQMTVGLIIGADFLLERKFKPRSHIKPGAKATGK